MGRLTLVSVLVFFSLNAKAVTEDFVPATGEIQHSTAELVVGANEEDIGDDLVILDENELGASLENFSDEELFASNGVLDIFAPFLRQQSYRHTGTRHSSSGSYSSNRRQSGGKTVGGCGSGRRCAATSGQASWYGPGFNGHRTADGETFNQNAMTAASRTICFNALVRVTYHGRSVVVRVNDDGPHAAGRVIDLSKAAASQLGISTGAVSLQTIKCG